MKYTVSKSSLDGLDTYRAGSPQTLNWSSVFVLPAWMRVWYDSFGDEYEICICVVHENDKIIGVAPLMTRGHTAYFVGDTDVCDYQDFIVAPGREPGFFNALLDDLKKNGIRELDLKHVRPDSTVMKDLASIAGGRGYIVESVREDVSYEMDLPSDFENYLASLTSKQRHEVRRKLRRLTEEGSIEYRFIENGPALDEALEEFFPMFAESRQDKASFLTDRMKHFFKSIVDVMAVNGLLKLGVLELDGKPVAEILCFDYDNCIYLYNSGYDPRYVSLSAGLLSKVLAIKDSIEKGKKKFDFLKGAEPYKAHLGGKEVPLYRCRIIVK